MKLNKEINIVCAIVFIMLIIVGGSETGYSSYGANIPGLFMMMFGGIGLLSQFILLNISLAKK